MTIKELFGIKPAPRYLEAISIGDLACLADRLGIPPMDLLDASGSLSEEAKAVKS